MNLKKLTQAVFEGLPPEYRWAAVDADGDIVIADHEHFFWHERKKWLFPSDKTIKIIVKTIGYDATDWQNSLIERQNVLTADIDWIEGAAYWCKPFPPIQPSGFFINADFTQVHDGVSWVDALPQVKDLQDGTYSKHVVKRPESIHDVARSIEAARVAEKVAGVTNFADLVLEDPAGSLAAEYEAAMPYPDGDPRYFETSDVVNNPSHYTTGGIECIASMQAMLSRDEFIGYLRGNIFKYQWRYKHKNGVEDLRKADWYAQRLIKVEGEK